MAWTAATTVNLNGLWFGVYKINSDQGGFTFKIAVANKDEAGARAVGEDIGKRIIQLLPQDAEVFRATMYCADSVRNGMALRNCIGQGNYGNLKTTPTVEKCDNSHSSLEIRLEDVDLGVVPRKFNLLPDSVSAADDLINPVTDVVGLPMANPALPVLNDTYAVQMNAFLQSLVYQTVHVQKGFVPGGAYNYKAWKNAYCQALGVKKGGRVSIR